MTQDLGHLVLNGKAIPSCDYGAGLRHTVPMADRMSETEETAAFIGRVRAAREAKFGGQKPVYKYLGIPQDQYKHFETKRPMPRRFIPKFCEITEVSMEWLLTGEGKGPRIEEPERQSAPRKARARQKAA